MPSPSISSSIATVVDPGGTLGCPLQPQVNRTSRSGTTSTNSALGHKAARHRHPEPPLQQFDIDADRATVRAALTSRDAIASWWSTRTDWLTDAGGTEPRLHVGFPDVPRPFEFTIRDDGSDRIEWVTGDFPPPWAGTTIRWDLLDRDDPAPGTRRAVGQSSSRPAARASSANDSRASSESAEARIRPIPRRRPSSR